MGKVGIVAAGGAVGAKVLVGITFGVQPLLYVFLQFVTCMV
jgi:hypothetical protein